MRHVAAIGKIGKVEVYFVSVDYLVRSRPHFGSVGIFAFYYDSLWAESKIGGTFEICV